MASAAFTPLCHQPPRNRQKLRSRLARVQVCAEQHTNPCYIQVKWLDCQDFLVVVTLPMLQGGLAGAVHILKSQVWKTCLLSSMTLVKPKSCDQTKLPLPTHGCFFCFCFISRGVTNCLKCYENKSSAKDFKSTKAYIYKDQGLRV